MIVGADTKVSHFQAARRRYGEPVRASYEPGYPCKSPQFIRLTEMSARWLNLRPAPTAVEDRLRELYAIEQVHKRLKSGDTLFEEARDRLEEAEDRFAKALSAAYNRVYFPSVDPIDSRAFLANVTIDNGLKLGKGDQSAEVQLEALLASPRANYKLAANLTESFGEFFAMAEEVLWPSGVGADTKVSHFQVARRHYGEPVRSAHEPRHP